LGLFIEEVGGSHLSDESNRIAFLSQTNRSAIAAQNALSKIDGIGEVRLRGGKIRFCSNDPLRLIQKLRNEWPDRGLRWGGWKSAEPDMDDVFEAFRTGRLNESPCSKLNATYGNPWNRENGYAA
jgi:hypothetical protein